MTDFYFDENWDMSLEGGDISFTSEENEVIQRLTAKLQFIQNDWFLNILAGLPYPNVIFEARTDLNDVYALLRQEIKNTEGVEALNELTIIPETGNRSILVNFKVNNGGETQTIRIP